MNKKRFLKMLTIITVVFTIIMTSGIFFNYIYASGLTDLYKKIYDTNDSDLVNNVGGPILFVAQLIGYGVSVITLIIVGIQYVIKSPDEKAKIKDRLIMYTTGAAILFGATSLVSALANFGIGLFK